MNLLEMKFISVMGWKFVVDSRFVYKIMDREITSWQKNPLPM